MNETDNCWIISFVATSTSNITFWKRHVWRNDLKEPRDLVCLSSVGRDFRSLGALSPLCHKLQPGGNRLGSVSRSQGSGTYYIRRSEIYFVFGLKGVRWNVKINSETNIKGTFRPGVALTVSTGWVRCRIVRVTVSFYPNIYLSQIFVPGHAHSSSLHIRRFSHLSSTF